jgi:oxalate decarboxylase/phosphoglucose isomerase-like protein (cupin superfamily)
MTEELPRTIENPVTGERVTFLATAKETNGEYVRIRNLDVRVGPKENHLVLAEGESVFVPLNTAHRFWNSSTEPVVFEVEIRPARKLREVP